MRYSVKAAARATGVSESALRTWERRYGIPRPARSASGRRLYEDADLNLIRRIAALIEAGIPASEAAAAVLTSPDLEPPAAPVEEDPMAGRVVAAALSLNESLVVSLLRESAETMGWAGALERVHFGSLRGIGEMWRENRVPSVTEHFLTEIVRSEIYRAIDGSDSAVGERTVVLACPQDERHDVGLLALSLLLRQRGVRTCYLGSDVPPDDLITILRNPSVAAVCIAATLVSSFASAARAARQIVAEKLRCAVFVGGPAFAGAENIGFIPAIILPRPIDAAAGVIASRLKKEAQ